MDTPKQGILGGVKGELSKGALQRSKSGGALQVESSSNLPQQTKMKSPIPMQKAPETGTKTIPLKGESPHKLPI
ncbi:MAG: hypothetical protein WCR04_02880 [Fibrobacteraceae bacterium]